MSASLVGGELDRRMARKQVDASANELDGRQKLFQLFTRNRSKDSKCF